LILQGKTSFGGIPAALVKGGMAGIQLPPVVQGGTKIVGGSSNNLDSLNDATGQLKIKSLAVHSGGNSNNNNSSTK
jgi:hypothetical protein